MQNKEPLKQIRKDLLKLKQDVSYLKDSVYALLQIVKGIEAKHEVVEVLHTTYQKDIVGCTYASEEEAKKAIENITKAD